MEPQIIDYYNEMPSGVNVIEKMNEELAQVQKENDELKKKLDIYKQREESNKKPIVIYKDLEELDRVKEEAYSEFYSYISNINFNELNPSFMTRPLPSSDSIENILNKLLKNKKINNWTWSTSNDILFYLETTIKSISEYGFLSSDLIYDIIKNYIDEIFNPEECNGIVKFRCEKCNELDDYLVDGECYECRFPDDY